MTQTLNEIIAHLAKWALAILTAAGGGAVVAYGVFKLLATKWLDQHFVVKLKELEMVHNEKLENLKHTHGQEIERLKHDINALFSRISKVHEKEFDVLPKAWFMLNELHGVVMLALDLTMKYSPDFRRLQPAELEEFLRTCELSDLQKDTLRRKDPSEQGIYYYDAMASFYLDNANEKLRLFRNYLIEYSLFMTEELRGKFSDAHLRLAKATSQYQIGRRAEAWEMVNAAQDTMQEDSFAKLIGDIERAIQARLHYDHA